MNVNPKAAEGSASKVREWLLLVTAWTLVCVPLGWGIFQTLKKALILFK